MDWCAKYIGIPFADHGAATTGCDCWGLVRMVYADVLGVALPDFACDYASASDRASVTKLLETERSGWVEVDAPRPLDVILINIQGRPWHVGVVASAKKMLHISRGADVILDDYTRPMWARRIEGFYRWMTSQKS